MQKIQETERAPKLFIIRELSSYSKMSPALSTANYSGKISFQMYVRFFHIKNVSMAKKIICCVPQSSWNLVRETTLVRLLEEKTKHWKIDFKIVQECKAKWSKYVSWKKNPNPKRHPSNCYMV